MHKSFLVSLALLLCSAAHAQVSLTTLGSPYTQDFNTLAASGTSSTLPSGWVILETGTSTAADGSYAAGTGSSNAGNVYSFGVAASTERALGGLLSGTLTPTLGAAFTNSTGSAITSIAISYTGEQWRLGALSRVDKIQFQYSTDATSLSTGTWTSVTALDFTAPVTSGVVGALDGNTAANRTAISSTISSLNIASGAAIWIRWTDFNAFGADDGLAVDDFSLTPAGTASLVPALSISDVSAAEGNAGATSFTFTISLSQPAGGGGVTFDIATAEGTATTANLDYVAQSLTGQTIPAGSSTYTFSVPVNGDLNVEPNETFFVNVTNVTGATVADGQGLGTIVNDDVTITSISAIQGSGLLSPLTGQVISTQGIVTARISNGFFLQTPDASVDADPLTSEGIFVFTSSAPPAAAAAGNSVQVTGTVAEFKPNTDPNSRTLTELTSPSVIQLSTGNALPTPIVISAANLTAAGGPDQLERFEGMLVQAVSLTVVAPTAGSVDETNAISSSNGVLFAVLPGVALPMREAGIEILDTPANPATACAAGVACTIPIFDANPERIRIDSDAAGQPKLDVNTGATLTNLIGVLNYASRAYTILPTQEPTVGGTQVSATVAPAPPSNAVTIAAMNVERLFDTVNDAGISDVVVTQAALDGRLGKISKTIRTHLRAPDVVALEEVENLSVAQALATRINSDAASAAELNPGYTAFLVEGLDPGGIDVAFLVRSGVTIESVTQLGAAATFTNPCTLVQDSLNDRPPLRFRGSVTRGSATLPFVVFVNHLRSLNGVADSECAAGGRVRSKRAAQADYLAQIVQEELTANPASKIILVGDFNAFEVNDGYVDSINAILGTPAPATKVLTATLDPAYPNMTNLLSLLQRAQQYSYVFDGNHQTLDHAILNPAALAQFVGGGYVRVNADFNETFRGNFNTPERYSDHDPVYVQLTTAANITAQLAIARAGIVYNRTALTATSSVRVTNNTAAPINGPLQLVITGLPDGVRLTNAASSSPASAIYNLAAPLAPGQTLIVPLAFSLNAVKSITYSAVVFAGGL
ncbi:MAG TPA: endonuclease/exonuclease/phosphatase family protein [Paludibaculum sp.]|jgi:hypothetical protein